MEATHQPSDLITLVDTVGRDTIDNVFKQRRDSGVFASDPILTAVKTLWDALRDGTTKVALRGRAAFDEAVELVARAWEAISGELGDRAIDVLREFETRIWKLIEGALNLSVRAMPANLDADFRYELESVSARLTWTTGASAHAAINRWLTIVCTGGVDFTVTYKKVSTT